MMIWGGRLVTFMTNSLVLIGYTLLYTWMAQQQEKTAGRTIWYRNISLFALTAAFLALFHFDSIFNMAQLGYLRGFGWNYINFQIATLLFALLDGDRRALVVGLFSIIAVWFWWLPNVPLWSIYAIGGLVLMLIASRFGPIIGSHRYLYYPFTMIFAAPFFAANYVSLRGINVGWPWQILSMLSLAGLLWTVHYRNEKLERRSKRLTKEARTDALTQLSNFRVFNEDLQAAYERLQANGTPYAMFTFDIDHFKKVNDKYGHLVGNTVLKQVAACLRSITAQLGYQCRCYRTGGEEFSFILFDYSSDFGHDAKIAAKVKERISQLAFLTDTDNPFHVTISIGQDRVTPNDHNYLDLYNRADKYLYNAKRAGRNTMTIRGLTLSNERSKPY